MANKDGKVLLQLRGDKKTWGILGGFMELGESSIDTLVREFNEESGISVQPKRLLNLYTKLEDSYPSGGLAQPISIVYEVEARTPYDIHSFTKDEPLALGFFSKEEIAELPLASYQHQVILDEYFSNTFKLGL